MNITTPHTPLLPKPPADATPETLRYIKELHNMLNDLYNNNYGDMSTLNNYSYQSLFDNAIINGDMRIDQRGGPYVSPSMVEYLIDRFYIGYSGAGRCTVSQDTDVPSNSPFYYSMKIDVTTSDSSIAASDYQQIGQRIEGYNFYPLSTCSNITLSFWAKSSKTGTFCVSFENSGDDRSYVVELSISSADTWKEYSVTIPMNYSGGTWNYTNGVGLEVHFALACGTDRQTTSNAWQSGDYLTTSNQTNFFDSTDNNFWITGVKLNKGNIATPFNPRPYGQEFALCQRYYETGYWNWILGGVSDGASTITRTTVKFQTWKRTTGYSFTPTDLNSNVGKITWLNNFDVKTHNNTPDIGTKFNDGVIVGDQVGTSNSGFGFSWECDDEL